MIPDPLASRWAKAARARQRQAHRPGTNAARQSAVRLFLAFCRHLKVNYRRLTFIHVCWFVEYLAAQAYTPGTISNHVSHIRTFYKLSSLQDAPLYHYRVHLALRAVAINVRHAPNPKLPVTPEILRLVIPALRLGPHADLAVLAILMMFMGFFRQSSLLPLSLRTFDHTRHPTPHDAWLTSAGLNIRLKWSKTLQRSGDLRTLLLPPTKDVALCPVKAYTRYTAQAPPTTHRGPLLALPDGNPATVRLITGLWKRALNRVGLPVTNYSLHSLRRGAATYTHNDANAKLNDVMAQGTWRSTAVRDYIRPSNPVSNTVHQALAAL